jgi:heme exporter protein D
VTFSEFMHMGGYGTYVWGAYGVVAVLMVLNTLIPILRHRRLLREAKLRNGDDNS